jgi:Ca2+-binding EF-hand superfamily protein
MQVPGIGGPPPMAMTGASGGPPLQKMTNLYDKIDTAGAGSINKAQFETAFNTLGPPAVFRQAGADAVFSKLDPSGSGQVSRADFIKGMQALMVSLRAAPPEG